MKFHSAAQEKAYKAAIKHKYKAIAFDVDGTLTPFSRFKTPDSLKETINAIAPKIHLILCTGRTLHYSKQKLGRLIDKPKKRKQWSIIADNGVTLNIFKNSGYKEVHKTPWPKKAIKKEVLASFIKQRLGWAVKVQVREHNVIVIFPKQFYLFPRIVRRYSSHIAKKLNHLLKEMNLGKDLKIQDSGIGSLIIPANAGKGHAIAHWAKLHKIPQKDILCIGDKAGPGENDEDFLSGQFGTPFTVGKQNPSKFPFPVLDKKDRKLWGPKGTEYLLKQIPLA